MARTCVECGSEVPGSSLQGYCPRCLLKLADESTYDSSSAEDISRQLPRSLGEYELLEVLGEGGMGIVFKAVQKKLNRTVALKMLRSGLLATREEMKRFHTEAKAVARLKHPNIVTVHEIGEYEGRLFFSMDCIQGRSLSQIVGRTPLTPDRAARYTMLIAEAVHYAHTQNVLHRDLKPGNVLVDSHDQPHITDFGLAKEISGDPGVTRSGAILGTPSYMSPEQATGRKHQVGPQADVYSLGAILYDLLTGRPPFRADSPTDTLRQVIEQEPAPLRVLNAKVPRNLETICLKCLAKDPARRYGSAELLAQDLGRFLRGEPIMARRVGGVERAYRWTMRHPAVAALQLAGLVMVGMLAYVARYSTVDARFNVEVTPRLAMGLAFEFERIGEVVTEVASHPMLVDSLAATQFMNPTYQKDPDNNHLLETLIALLKDRASSVRFGNYLLLNMRGDVLANYTTDTRARVISPKTDREYFRAASVMTNGYYVSRGYTSESDDRLKVAVIAPIMDGNKFIGALGRMVPYTELASQTERTKLSVISEMDPTTAPNNYAVIWHPNLSEKEMVPIQDEHPLRQTLDAVMRESRQTLTSYKDPVDTGQWVAGLAKVPVPGEHLILVYQVRDRVRQAFLAGAFLFVPWAVALGVWLLRKPRPNLSSS